MRSVIVVVLFDGDGWMDEKGEKGRARQSRAKREKGKKVVKREARDRAEYI